MPLKLLYITRDQEVARIVERCGVDWVFVDLEARGKVERQAGRNTVISGHTLADVAAVRQVLTRARLLVRVNPWGEGSAEEIDAVTGAGADIVMLPYFTRAPEVEQFVQAVGGRARTCLLVETPGAVQAIDAILAIPGIDCVHIGLNDLHIAFGQHFMFEPLADGTVERLCRKCAARGIEYGFGGMARIGKLVPPAEDIVAEHYRLGSSMVILARSFCDAAAVGSLEALEAAFRTGVQEIRDWEAVLAAKDAGFFERNRQSVVDDIRRVARQLAAVP
jgi:2-keto-3-deoxy-L-rhamnonate aldolase RhmA